VTALTLWFNGTRRFVICAPLGPKDSITAEFHKAYAEHAIRGAARERMFTAALGD
jgi:hypothetical protein